MGHVRAMIPVMNVDELEDLFAAARSAIPPQAYEQIISYASQSVDLENWAKLKLRLGIH